MKLPAWLAGLLFLAWTIWSTHDYYCNKCGCCSNLPVPAISAPVSLTGVPMFNPSDATAQTGTLFGAWKTAQLATCGDGDTLVITGTWRDGEENKSTFADLGLARAAAVRALFAPEAAESRVKIASKKIEGPAPSAAVEGVEIACAKMVLSETKTTIIENGNKTTIHFPSGSAARERNAEVDAYLLGLCAKHKDDKSAFAITGHTDNIGNETANIKLGMDRAMAVRQILRDCGIARERIAAASEGPKQPAEDNATPEGRYRNRRVEITVNQ